MTYVHLDTLQVLDKVKSIVSKQLGVEEEKVTESSKFVDDLGADSLDAVEMVMALEDEFGVEIGEESAEKLSSVQVINFLCCNLYSLQLSYLNELVLKHRLVSWLHPGASEMRSAAC